MIPCRLVLRHACRDIRAITDTRCIDQQHSSLAFVKVAALAHWKGEDIPPRALRPDGGIAHTEVRGLATRMEIAKMPSDQIRYHSGLTGPPEDVDKARVLPDGVLARSRARLRDKNEENRYRKLGVSIGLAEDSNALQTDGSLLEDGLPTTLAEVSDILHKDPWLQKNKDNMP